MFQSKIWFFSLNFKSISLSRKQSTCCTCSCRFIPFPSISFRVNVNDKLFQCCLLVLFMYAYGVYHTPATQSADMAGIIHIPDIFLSCFALVFTLHTCTLTSIPFDAVICGSVIEYTCQTIAISFPSDVHFSASFRIQTFSRAFIYHNWKTWNKQWQSISSSSSRQSH